MGLLFGEAEVYLLKRNCFYKGLIEHGKAKGKGIFRNLDVKYAFNGQWFDSRPVNGTLTLESHEQIRKLSQEKIYYRDKK